MNNKLNRTVSLKSKLWLKISHFPILLDLIIWIYGLEEFAVHFKLFMKRLRVLYSKQILNKRRNSRFVFTHLKDAFTITISCLYSETRYIPKTRVSTDSNGFPRIIPFPLRKIMVENRNVLLGVLTLLGFHRIIQYKPKVDLSTIESPFTGMSRTLDITEIFSAIKNLMVQAGLDSSVMLKLKLPGIRGLLIQKSGPNGPSAFRNILVDAFAFINHPKVLWALLQWFNKYGGRRYAFSLILIISIGFPIAIITKAYYHLGRLGVVYDTAGKARVVGMTNWWIQIALYPLHNSIFDFLRKLPTDGTFDQHKPIKGLCDRKLDSKFYSLDLSAATDRLPLDLQVQILSLVTDVESANLWKQLVSIPFLYNPEDQNEIPRNIRYAVGQPMGAYSSWAMLALTHHVIVNVAAKGIFTDYAVLGDDLVIQSDSVSQEYLRIMNILGVEISLPKSMVSYNHLEFAKKVFDKSGNMISMISPALFLAVLKERLLAGLLLAEGVSRGIFSISHTPAQDSKTWILKMIQTCPGFPGDRFEFGLWSLFGIRGLVLQDQQAARLSGVSWLSIRPGHTGPVLAQSLFDALVKQYIKQLNKTVSNTNKALRTWYTEFN